MNQKLPGSQSVLFDDRRGLFLGLWFFREGLAETSSEAVNESPLGDYTDQLAELFLFFL